MLMVTAAGTAVRAERASEPEEEGMWQSSGPVSARKLSVESRTQKLVRKVEEGTISVDEETWKFLIENRVEELAKPIRGMLVGTLKKLHRSDADKLSIKRGRDYFLAIDREVAKKHLYNMLHDHEPNRKRAEDRAWRTLLLLTVLHAASAVFIH
jgi:hypothetical protein